MSGEKCAPCLHCPNRSIDCHGKCELYQKWCADHKREMQEHRDADGKVWYTLRSDQMRKLRRKHRHKYARYRIRK